jgi:adhesin HecA-like repeat protein
MSTITWTSQIGGDWADPTNWQGGVVPGAADDAIIQSTLAATITVSTLQYTYTITVDDPAATFVILNAGTIVASGDVTLNVGNFIDPGSIYSTGTVSITVPGTISVLGFIDAPAVTITAGQVLLMTGTVTGPGANGITTVGTFTPGTGTIAVGTGDVRISVCGTLMVSHFTGGRLSAECSVGQARAVDQSMFLCSVQAPASPSRPALVDGGAAGRGEIRHIAAGPEPRAAAAWR